MSSSATALRLALSALVLGLLGALWSSGEGIAQTTHANRHGTFIVDGERFFPIGVTMPPRLGSRTPHGRDALAELVAAGVTLYRTGPRDQPWTPTHLSNAIAWADAAAQHGVYTWVYLRELALVRPGWEREELLRQVIAALKDKPGMGLWKGADEPYSQWLPPALAYAYRVVKRNDPDHAVLTVFAPRSRDRTMLVHPPDPPNLRGYNRVTDLHGVDVYPIYYHLRGVRPPKLHMVGMWTRAMRRATGRNTIATTLQICSGGSDDPAGSGAYTLPTTREERYMAYDAIVNGARGLNFYGGDIPRCLNRRDRALGWNWAFWNRTLRGLVREIGIDSPLHPALLRPETTRRLDTGNAGTQAISRRVGRTLWVIATQRGPTGASVTIRGLPAWARAGRSYPGGRLVSARNGRLRVSLPGWGVQVMRFTQPAP